MILDEDMKKEIIDRVLNELVEKDTRTYYDDDYGEYYSAESWKFKENVKNGIRDRVGQRLDEILDKNKDAMNAAVEELVCSILPQVVYDKLSSRMDEYVSATIHNTVERASGTAISRLRDRLRLSF
jgi:hypothetical protein